jgi:hypothetical protein
LKRDDLVVQRLLRLVHVLDEAGDAALEAEVVHLARALVGDGDVQARVEERQLAQPRRQRVEVVRG